MLVKNQMYGELLGDVEAVDDAAEEAAAACLKGRTLADEIAALAALTVEDANALLQTACGRKTAPTCRSTRQKNNEVKLKMVYHVQFPGLGLDLTINRVALAIGGFNIYWYGVIIAAGMLLAMLYASTMPWTTASTRTVWWTLWPSARSWPSSVPVFIT